MDKYYNRHSLIWGTVGLVLQSAGIAMSLSLAGKPMPLLEAALIIAGALALIVGLCLYARALGRHPAWGLLGLLSWVGLLALVVFVKDRRTSQMLLVCPNCGFHFSGEEARQ